MTSTKTYLNVPFAEKDTAKALGARWDAAMKKWYAPGTADITLFAKWATESAIRDTSSIPASIKDQTKAGKLAADTITRPSIKDFVAYDGDLPPWN
jgi:hypothetical protein